MNALRLVGPVSLAVLMLASCDVEPVELGASEDSQNTNQEGGTNQDAGTLGCTEPSPAGCVQTGCPSGQVCDTNAGCKSSDCRCDAASGTWTCTRDCGGGTCVPGVEDGGGASDCQLPSPAGCIQNGCPADQVCDRTIGCKSSQCNCDSATGNWNCTRDCGGGTCVPRDDSGAPGCPTDFQSLNGQACSTPGRICEYGHCVVDWHANLRCINGTWRVEQISCMNPEPCGPGGVFRSICAACGLAGGCRQLSTCTKACQTQANCAGGEYPSCRDGVCQAGPCI